jgi:hypothetical protein
MTPLRNEPWELILIRQDQVALIAIEALLGNKQAQMAAYIAADTLKHGVANKVLCLFCDRIPGIKAKVVGAFVPIKKESGDKSVSFVICEVCAEQDNLMSRVMKRAADAFGITIIPMQDGGRA